MLSAADADNIPVPLGLFISNDEPVDEVHYFGSIYMYAGTYDESSVKV